MKVKELIAILQSMPQDANVEVNDNNGGEVWEIESVDDFTEHEDPVIIIQVNCD